MAQVVVELTGDEAKLLRSMQKVIDQQSKLKDSIKSTGKESKDSSSSSVDGLARMATAYVSVSSAIGVVKQALQDQVELQRESLNIAQEIAKSQSGATKNLTGLSAKDKALALDEAKKLQAEIGFSDQKYIVDAIGAGYSASGDLEATKSAVRAAAELSRNAPDELAEMASGALDISRGSGVKDARANLGFALQVGAISRVEDPAALTRTLAPAIAAGVNSVANQDKQDASKEIGAVFSELNKFANDIKGESTKTATIDLMSKMEEFFRTLPEERAKTDVRVAELELKQEVTPVEQAKLARADFEVAAKTEAITTTRDDLARKQAAADMAGDAQGPNAVNARRKLAEAKIKAEDAIIDLAEATSRRDALKVESGLSDAEAMELAKLRKQQSAMKGVEDTGTVFGRLEQFQQSPDLRDKFLENPFGEAAFKGGFRQLLTSGTDIAKAVEADKKTLSFDSTEFNRNVAEQETLSPELRVAKPAAMEEGRKQLERTTGDRPMQGVVEQIVSNSLRENRRALIGGVLDFAHEGTSNLISAGSGSNIRETATLGMQSLELRKWLIQDAQTFGKNSGDDQKLANLDRAIGQIAQLLAEAEAPRTTEAVRMDREIAEGKKPVATRDATSEKAPEQIDTLALLKAAIEKIERNEAKQAQENLAAQQLEVLKSIEAKSGVAPDANANAIRAQVMGAN